MYRILIVSILVFVFASCKDGLSEKDKTPLAKVFDKYLYLEDIEGILTEGMSKADSAAKLESYVNSWVKKELFVKKAELNLSDKDKDFQKMIDEYRADLLIHSYEKLLIEQKLDTNISDSQIESFYEQESAQFLLNFNIVKVLFVKISSEVKDNYKVKSLYMSNSERDIEKLEKICRENSATYDNFSDEWVQFSEILEYLPEKLENQKDFLKGTSHIETKDSLYNYYVKITDYKLIGEVSPLVFVKSNLKTIILNQRKRDLTTELEKSMFQNALNDGNIEIFDEKKSK